MVTRFWTRLMSVLLIVFFFACKKKDVKKEQVVLESMKVEVLPSENRIVAFSNKMDSYYQTQTHVLDSKLYSWFNGWNIAQKRIFSDYKLTIDGTAFDRANSNVSVFPNYLERRTPKGIERLRLFDDQRVLEVAMDSVKGETVSMSLEVNDHLLSYLESDESGVWYKSSESGFYVLLTSGNKIQKNEKSNLTVVPSNGHVSYYVLYGDKKELLISASKKAIDKSSYWASERSQRMNRLITTQTFTKTNDPLVTSSLRWFTITMDGLVTHQRGSGIYAGVPWFNEYWGRDTFISLPGGTYVLGNNKVAKQILWSFSSVQDSVESSKYYGRIPNIVKMESLNYHTTDGTPRFINQMMEYIRYSGDTSLIKEIYPIVKRSIDGSLKNWVNKRGYLTHENNETWMDARRASDKKSYSPRGTCANDIQALWRNQLSTGIFFAKHIGSKEDQKRWEEAYLKVSTNFIKDYWNKKEGYLADRIDKKGVAEFKLRPNQLFALDFINDPKIKLQVVKTVWENLVYPWGVSSLDKKDKDFHPYHLAWEHYHKDEAYHNGTVWQWLNGIAMQRMIEVGGEDIAYQLFHNMCDQGMNKTGVGCINENSDCFPHPGESYPKLTGTYWQAWSQAEHLRVWYQYFIGVRPDKSIEDLLLMPRIPEALNNVTSIIPIKGGKVHFTYRKNKENVSEFTYKAEGFSSATRVDIKSFKDVKLTLSDGDIIKIVVSDKLHFVQKDSSGKEIINQVYDQDNDKVKYQEYVDRQLKTVDFAQPDWSLKYPVLNKNYGGSKAI